MAKKASEIYERMKRTQSGFHYRDFRTLYQGFGFRLIVAKRHDVYIHPEFTHLRDTIPRHGELSPAYARDAVKLIETLLKLRHEKEQGQ